MNKKFYLIPMAVLSATLLFTTSACGLFGGEKGGPSSGEKPVVSGTFTFSKAIKNNQNTAVSKGQDEQGIEIIEYYTPAGEKTDLGDSLRVYNTQEAAAVSGDMYCSVYPFNTVSGSRISYTVNQSLKLKKDFTYVYSYSIILTNMEDWGKDCAKIEVSMAGTFTGEEIDEDNPDTSLYSVKLSDPVSGTQKIYGSTVSGEGSIYAWTINASATYSLDVETEKSIDPEFSFNRYLTGRTVKVDKMEKALDDDIYYSDILNDVAPYSECAF